MKKREKKLLALLASALLFALAVSFGGGCGGSDSDSRDIHVIGQLHGDYADELTALYDVMAPGGEINAPIIVSHEEGLNLTDEDANLLKKYLMAGQAVGIEHVDQTEVNLFLDKLGFKTDDSIAPEDTYYEYYGIKVIGNDIFSYVMLNDIEKLPEKENRKSENILVSDGTDLEIISQDMTLPDLPAGISRVISGDSIIVTSGDETYTMEKKAEAESGVNNDFALADAMVGWMYDNKKQSEYARRGRNSVEEDINEGAANSSLRGAGAVNLKEVSSLYQRTYNCSQLGNTLNITVDVYACHTFNAADSQDSDWFIVKQQGQLNPSANYKTKKSKGIKTAAQVAGYMVYYEFINTPVTGDSSHSHVSGVKLGADTAPGNTGSSTSVSSGINVDLGGNVGFSGFSATGGFNVGVSYSDSESFSCGDTQIENNSASAGSNITRWKYSFSRPTTTGHPVFGYSEFRDSPENARALFSPVNYWTWIVPASEREKAKGFKMNFNWATGYSNSATYAWGIKLDNVDHYTLDTQKKEIYVPFCAYPPLIAGGKLNFTKAAGDKELEIACARDWEASSDSDWCTLTALSGTKADLDAGEFPMVQVTANDTGANRTAWITLKTADGKGETKVKVFPVKELKSVGKA